MGSANPIFKEGRRYLSGSEVYLHQLTKHNEHYMLFINVDTFISPVELADSLIHKALITLSNKHYLLRSKITNDSNGDKFFELIDASNGQDGDWIQFKSIIVEDVYDWTSIVNGELQIGFSDDGPLWRAVILKTEKNVVDFTYTLIFTCNHCILDGRGAFDVLAKQFISILDSLLPENILETLPVPVGLLKSCTDLFFDMQGPISVQPYYLLTMFVNMFLWLQKKIGADVTKRLPDIRVYEEYKEGRHIIYPFHLDEELTIALIRISKQNSISVTALLLVLISSALLKTTKDFPLCKDAVKSFMYSTDMRKFNKELSTAPLGCGTFMDVEYQEVIPMENLTDKKLFLTVATKVSEDIKKRIQQPNFCKKLIYMGMIPLVRNEGIGIQERLINAPDLDRLISLSNIGNCDELYDAYRNSPPGRIKLVDHYFTVCSPSPMLFTVGTYQQQMKFCICYNGHWLDAKFINTFVNNFKRMALEACVLF